MNKSESLIISEVGTSFYNLFEISRFTVWDNQCGNNPRKFCIGPVPPDKYQSDTRSDAPIPANHDNRTFSSPRL